MSFAKILASREANLGSKASLIFVYLGFILALSKHSPKFLD
jgi:hypothetical protein